MMRSGAQGRAPHYLSAGPFPNPTPRRETPVFFDALPESLTHERVILGGAGEVTAIEVPSSARAVRITPDGAAVIFAIDEDPVAPEGISGATLSVQDFKPGNIAQADRDEVRILGPERNARSLRLMSETADVEAVVEFFGHR